LINDNQISGAPAELHAVLTITRKETGVSETYNITGHISADDVAKIIEEAKNDDHTQHPGA
jgi:hypothetical protein